MPKLKIQIDDSDVIEVQGSVKVIYEFQEEEIAPELDSEQLHMKFTTEGFVTDAIQNDEVVDTKIMDVGEVFQAMIDSRNSW